MKILENTLSVELDIWEDPGDYPSNAGQFPLPSSYQLEDITGHLIIQIEPSDREMDDWHEQGTALNLCMMMDDHKITVQGVRITSWQLHPEMDLKEDYTVLDIWKIIPYEWDDSDFSL